MKYNIEYADIGYDHRDSGPWRSKELSTAGDDLQELLNNVAVSSIDQDGGELDTVGYEDLSQQDKRAVDRIIAKLILEGDKCAQH